MNQLILEETLISLRYRNISKKIQINEVINKNEQIKMGCLLKCKYIFKNDDRKFSNEITLKNKDSPDLKFSWKLINLYIDW